MPKLDALRLQPRWVSHMGCLKGCLDFLKRDVSVPWLYGASGHAFVLNIPPGLCPSGPTDFNTNDIVKMGRNLGYTHTEVCGWKGKDNLSELQEAAWKMIRESIDEGRPCYGWELDIPEYCVIYGYDESGCYISGPGCDIGKGPISWRVLGTSEIGVVEVRSLWSAEPQSLEKTLTETLSFAVKYARDAKPWTDPHSAAGLNGYDFWISELESLHAAQFGNAFNAVVWRECRQQAAAFLEEVCRDSEMPGPVKEHLERAAKHYGEVAAGLSQFTELYPFDSGLEMIPVEQNGDIENGAGLLKSAKHAEESGLEELDRALARL